MDVAIKTCIVLLVLYVAGRIMYQGRGKKYRFRMMHVVLNFVAVMAFNALIMGLLVALSVALELLAGTFAPELVVPLFTPSGKVAGGNLLVYIFVLMFLTAFLHFGVRAGLRSVSKLFILEPDEVQIFEYFIQWLTIYLVVYQCIFEGFRSYYAWAYADVEGLSAIFEILLKPENVNLVMQPLLISGWILVVLERFAHRNRPKRLKEQGVEKGQSPLNGKL